MNRPKFIPPRHIPEELRGKVQRATDPKWRPCWGILHTSSAFSVCCPVIKGERKKEVEHYTKYFCHFFLQLLFPFFFPSPPLPNLMHSQHKQPKANVSPSNVWASCIADKQRQKESNSSLVSFHWLHWCDWTPWMNCTHYVQALILKPGLQQLTL